MILLAAMFSCIDPIFSIAASLSFKDAFYTPIDESEKRKADLKKQELGKNQLSDHLILAEALFNYERVKSTYKFCKEYYLSWNTLNLLSEMKKQFACLLFDMKFLESPDTKHLASNINSNNRSLIRAILTAGFYPNAAKIMYLFLISKLLFFS